MIFESKILESQVLSKENKVKESESILRTLLIQKLDTDQEANVYFELFRQVNSNVSRGKALAIYEKLYAATPQYLFKERIQELNH